jgi:hypothetical protein
VTSGVTGSNWYRFVGAGGDALPLKPPLTSFRCGTRYGGWLSGWNATIPYPGNLEGAAKPPTGYGASLDDHGRYPASDEGRAGGVVTRWVCFSEGLGKTCRSFAIINMVRCDGFLLFRLGSQRGCQSGYCTASSAEEEEDEVGFRNPTVSH